MQTWEYWVDSKFASGSWSADSLEYMLNNAGEDGWELVSMNIRDLATGTEFIATFKRPKD